MLDPDRCRAQDVPGRVERYPDTVDIKRLAVLDAADSRVGPEPPPEHAHPRRGGQIGGAAPGGVIAVGVGDDRTVDRAPRVYVESARFAEQPAIGGAEQCHAVGRPGGMSVSRAR